MQLVCSYPRGPVRLLHQKGLPNTEGAFPLWGPCMQGTVPQFFLGSSVGEVPSPPPWLCPGPSWGYMDAGKGPFYFVPNHLLCSQPYMTSPLADCRGTNQSWQLSNSAGWSLWPGIHTGWANFVVTTAWTVLASGDIMIWRDRPLKRVLSGPMQPYLLHSSGTPQLPQPTSALLLLGISRAWVETGHAGGTTSSEGCYCSRGEYSGILCRKC